MSQQKYYNNNTQGIPVGSEQQVSNVKCTRPFLSCEGADTQTNALCMRVGYVLYGALVSAGFALKFARKRLILTLDGEFTAAYASLVLILSASVRHDPFPKG